jgi:hypothetical protein
MGVLCNTYHFCQNLISPCCLIQEEVTGVKFAAFFFFFKGEEYIQMDFIPHIHKQVHFLKTIGTGLMKDEIHTHLPYSMQAMLAQI